MKYFLMLLLISPLSADPWGKDADLVYRKKEMCAPAPCRTPIFGQIAEGIIRFHQTFVSPADGPRSNYRPTSSQYMQQAIRKYGFFRGFPMGCDRLMRENPDIWYYPTRTLENGCLIKLDPVP